MKTRTAITRRTTQPRLRLDVYFLDQQWLSDAFWMAVLAAERMALEQVPEADPMKIRDCILREWLTMSVPAGRG